MECVNIQNYLISKGFPCTKPIGKPVRLQHAILQLEEFNADGEYKDPHLTEIMNMQAESAKKIIDSNPDGKIILSHEDWSNKHFRFKDGKISIIYDWDSIKRVSELYTIAVACCNYTATWYIPVKHHLINLSAWAIFRE